MLYILCINSPSNSLQDKERGKNQKRNLKCIRSKKIFQLICKNPFNNKSEESICSYQFVMSQYISKIHFFVS